MPYTGQPATVPTDEVRLLLGDTDVDHPRLSDDEILYFYNKGDQVPVRAAYLGAQALIAKYSQKLSASIGRVANINYTGLVQQYQGLLRMLAAEGGKPSAQLVGPPVDRSSYVPAIIGPVEWSNRKTW